MPITYDEMLQTQINLIQRAVMAEAQVKELEKKITLLEAEIKALKDKGDGRSKIQKP